MQQNTRKAFLQKKFLEWFFWFWIRQYRISYLIVLTITVIGIVAVMGIPKESSPAVKLWMISVSTVYIGTNPVDMDALVSDKIYKEIKDIKWIDKVTTNSSLWVSSVLITLKSNANTKDLMNDVRNAVSRVQLPSDAKTPVISEIETDTNRAFSVYVYSKNSDIDKAVLFDKAKRLQDIIETVPGVNDVALSAAGWQKAIWSAGWSDATYDVQIIIPDEQLTNLWLTLPWIAWIIQGYNKDQPIGNFAIGDKKYDFRIEWKNQLSFDFLKAPIPLSKWWSIPLESIATIQRKYKNDTTNTIVMGGSWKEAFYPFVWLTINKTDGANIFQASDDAKKVITEAFSRPEFQWFGFTYGTDLADTIRDDYAELFHEAIITLLLVFVAMYAFVGFKDSLFATFTLPLAFLSTFILLFYGGYTMNFLTNFSLILSFGIAVDTIIVIVQAASAKIRVWYAPRTAIMLALREYAIPIISWVMTTIVVFIPMMTLPWIMGKFLAYIPITIFGVLATGLVLALTVNSALYLLVVKNRKEYVDDPHAIEYADDDEKELLTLERIGKVSVAEWKAPLRIRVIHTTTEKYKKLLRFFLETKKIRRISIITPVVLLVLSFIFLAPRVGLELFPSDDNAYVSFYVEWPVWQRTERTKTDLVGIEKLFTWYPEIEYATVSIGWNQSTVNVQLTKRKVRQWLNQRSVDEIEKILLQKLGVFESRWYKVTSQAVKWWPPGWKAVWLKLIADKPEQLPTLIQVSKDFESYLKKMPGTKNVGKSSKDTPGQFIFELDKNKIALFGLTPNQIYSQISQNMNGITVGTVEDNGEDMSVILKSWKFLEDVCLEDILAIPIAVWPTTYVVWDFINSTITNATALITRVDGKIQITVDGDLDLWGDSISMQSKFEDFAKSYNFPTGISYEKWGETEENSELITAILSSFFIAVVIIFAILTLQFNSFAQPLIVLYSVIMSLPFVMLGLLITDNQFSLPFGIGFIAFTGIAVNHGIILIDAINQNLKKWMEWITALIEAGSSRLEPMTLTTVTTALGILPIALRDRFWSGMGFTIIFGIITASFITLFIVKGLYYELFVVHAKKKEKSDDYSEEI